MLDYVARRCIAIFVVMVLSIWIGISVQAVLGQRGAAQGASARGDFMLAITGLRGHGLECVHFICYTGERSFR